MITMLLFEWASRIETVGDKLAEGKGLREGGIRKNCGNLWKYRRLVVWRPSGAIRGARELRRPGVRMI
jgi:hypothetical protein